MLNKHISNIYNIYANIIYKYIFVKYVAYSTNMYERNVEYQKKWNSTFWGFENCIRRRIVRCSDLEYVLSPKPQLSNTWFLHEMYVSPCMYVRMWWSTNAINSVALRLRLTAWINSAKFLMSAQWISVALTDARHLWVQVQNISHEMRC